MMLLQKLQDIQVFGEISTYYKKIKCIYEINLFWVVIFYIALCFGCDHYSGLNGGLVLH